MKLFNFSVPALILRFYLLMGIVIGAFRLSLAGGTCITRISFCYDGHANTHPSSNDKKANQATGE